MRTLKKWVGLAALSQNGMTTEINIMSYTHKGEKSFSTLLLIWKPLFSQILYVCYLYWVSEAQSGWMVK